MTPIEPVSLSFGAALVLGLGFGSGPCNIACIPYLGPVFVGTEASVRRAWRTILPFSLGRLSGYAAVGLAGGWIGLLVQDWLAGPWGRWLLGGAAVLVALSMLARQRKRPSTCNTESAKRSAPVGFHTRHSGGLPGGLYLMGAGMALNPCAPLTTVILAAATTASAAAGLSLGLGFGLGAVILPSVIFGLGFAHFGAQLRLRFNRWRGTLEKAGVGLLIFMGAGTAMGWITP